MNNRPRVLFFGSPELAIPSLNALQHCAETVAVVTRPDRPAGRGQAVQETPIAKRATELSLAILKPAMFSAEVVRQLADLKADVGVVVAYGKILPPEILSLTPGGLINLHPSLLPKYRGPSPIASALLAGEKTTGVSFIILDNEVDHGPLLSQAALEIAPHEHRPALEKRLSDLGASLICQVLHDYLGNGRKPQIQNHQQATVSKMLKKDNAWIDWSQPAVQIANQIRAFDPWPGTVTNFKNKPLKILAGIRVSGIESQLLPGTVVLHQNRLIVACGVEALELISLQEAGGRAKPAQVFASSHPDLINSQFHSR